MVIRGGLRRITTSLVSALTVTVVTLTFTQCTRSGHHTTVTPQSISSRVAATPAGLTLDGHPWWPTGFNAYQLASNHALNPGCGATNDPEAYFASLPPHSLTRFNAFAALAVNVDTGRADFRAIDDVFAAAKRHDQFVVPVLAAGDGACEGDHFKDRDWFASGWHSTPASLHQTFSQWVATAVTRWRNEPTLAGWTLVGEPEPLICTSFDCGESARRCPDDATAVLRRFVDTAGDELRRLDSQHPIWGGQTGGGQCGTAGDEYTTIAASPDMDVLEYHDYGADGVPLPGDRYNGLARRIQQAKEVAKPLVVAEIGENAGSCRSLQTRADNVRTKIIGQRQAGTDGALLWAWVPDPRPQDCTFDIGLGDPLYSVVADLAEP
ncbi:beta-mannosidase [Gordonia jinhuaensis]|uniref:beta-mannosidase n=1 Tax=Gordonia jinhuaensis TaxID=1517702 RepID=UPI001663F1B8|nr:beta-mannosidase [Gordonia jinhuaensis]